MNNRFKLIHTSIGCIFFIVGFSCFSFGQEQITITTYYPSPSGSYQALEARRLVIGNTAMPTVNGLVHFQGLAADPAFAQDGVMYYNSTTRQFRYFNAGTGLWQNVSRTCQRFNFTAASGQVQCPVGLAIPMAPVRPENTNGSAATSGSYLCCPT